MGAVGVVVLEARCSHRKRQLEQCSCSWQVAAPLSATEAWQEAKGSRLLHDEGQVGVRPLRALG